MQKLVIYILLFFLLTNCKDTGISIEEPEDILSGRSCKIVRNTRPGGSVFQFTYENGRVVGIEGFADFDRLVYNGDQIDKAINSRDNSYEVDFEYNERSQLIAVIFNGRDSQGRLFSNRSTLVYNTRGQVDEIQFRWPTIDRVSAFINYDDKGNILNISGEYQNRLQNFLVNKSFDDKNSPYKNQKIGEVLSYFMIYGLIVGGENWTYYLNNNNVTSSEVNVGDISRKIGVDYTYNALNFPLSAEMTINQRNRLSSAIEYFDYNCQ